MDLWEIWKYQNPQTQMELRTILFILLISNLVQLKIQELIILKFTNKLLKSDATSMKLENFKNTDT